MIALKSLGLTPDELNALIRQGSVCTDSSGRCRLQFRICGRRRTKYLGIEETAFVDRVRRELEFLQGDLRNNRRLGRQICCARASLRRNKTQVAMLAAPLGYHFRGADLRRKIAARRESVCSDQSVQVYSESKVMDDRNENRNTELRKTPSNAAERKPNADSRKERFDALREEATAFKSPLRRAARFAAAELLEIGSHLAESIKQGFSGPVKSPKDLPRNLLSALGKLAGIHRSASRYAQLDEKLGRNADDPEPIDHLESSPKIDERGET